MAKYNDIYIPGKGYADTTISKDDINKLGTYHMALDPELYEPLRTNNFEFIVVGLGEKVRLSLDTAKLREPVYFRGINWDSQEKAFDTAIEEVIRVAVDSAFIPHFTQSPVPVKRGNSTLKFAGQPTFNNGTIRVKDYIGMDTKMALMEWQNLSYNVKTEKIGLASDYKLTCYLKEYTPDYIPVRTWKLYGCWISGISESPFDSSSSDNLNQITATIEYDRAVPDND